MESLGLALVVLAAVLVGAAIPVLVQLRATLRAMHKTLQRSDEALGATTAAARRIDALVVRLEEGGRIEQLVDGLAAVSRMVGQLRDTARVASAVGAAVGPAVAAAVRALREDREATMPTPLQPAPVDSGAVPPEPRRQAMP